MVLVPSVLLSVVVLVGAGVLTFQGFYVQQVAVSVRQVSLPAVDALASLEKERQLSMALLAEPSQSPGSLAAQRRESDRKLSTMLARAPGALARAPQEIKDRMADLTGYLDKVSSIRAQVDAGTISSGKVFTFYNNLQDTATQLFNTQARIVPDETSSQGGIAATNVYRLGDLMSRAGSQAATAFAADRFDASDYRSFAQLVGAYHSQLQLEKQNVVPEVRASAQTLEASHSWKQLVVAENALLDHGPWTHGVPSGLPVDEARWTALSTSVSDSLIALAKRQADIVSGQALDNGNTKLAEFGSAFLVALVGIILLIVWSWRQSTAFAARHTRLRDRTLALVEDLPNIIRRHREGAAGESTAGLGLGEHGDDELGQVADAFSGAHGAAVAAAVQEADGREGMQKTLVGLARRLQRPTRQLQERLNGLETEEQDPDRLDHLFALDHQATQVLRNVENLLILGGEQPGRRWRRPVPLPEVLRAAAQETRDFTRVRVQVPDRLLSLHLVPGAIGPLVHMIADLADNALSFSSPERPVTLVCHQVDGGLVIEVEDRGIGLPPADIERANERLRQTPDFNVRDIGDASQLGFWLIARLAHNLEVKVQLRNSPYGGVQAIALLPHELLAEQTEVTGHHPQEQVPVDQSRPEPAPVGDLRSSLRQAAGRPADSPAAPPPPPAAPPQPPALVPVFGAAGAGMTLPQRGSGGPPPVAPAAQERTPGFAGQPPVPPGPQDPGPVGSRHAAPSPYPRPVVGSPPAPRQPAPALPPLPQRSAGESLAEPLRNRTAAAPNLDRASEVLSTRSPEEEAARWSSYQRGTRRGREADA